jgi:cell division protein ZapA
MIKQEIAVGTASSKLVARQSVRTNARQGKTSTSRLVSDVAGVTATQLTAQPLGEGDSKVFHFHILGVPYKLKTSHDDEMVAQLIDYVNRLMNQAVGVTKNGSFQNAAVLTALNLAEELIVFKRKVSQELEKIEAKALLISKELESQKETK